MNLRKHLLNKSDISLMSFITNNCFSEYEIITNKILFIREHDPILNDMLPWSIFIARTLYKLKKKVCIIVEGLYYKNKYRSLIDTDIRVYDNLRSDELYGCRYDIIILMDLMWSRTYVANKDYFLPYLNNDGIIVDISRKRNRDE